MSERMDRQSGAGTLLGGDDWSNFVAAIGAGDWAESISVAKRMIRAQADDLDLKVDIAQKFRGRWGDDVIEQVKTICDEADAEAEALAKAEAAKKIAEDDPELRAIRRLRRLRDPKLAAPEPEPKPAPKPEPEAESVAQALAAAATAKVRKFAPSTKPELGRGSGFLDRVGGTGRIAFPDIPDAPQAPANASEIDRLTYPRGLLGHVTQYMVDTSPLPHRWLSLASALCALAKGLDRKVIGPSGTSTVL